VALLWWLLMAALVAAAVSGDVILSPAVLIGF